MHAITKPNDTNKPIIQYNIPNSNLNSPNLIHNDMDSIMRTVLSPGLLTTMLLFEEGSRRYCGEG